MYKADITKGKLAKTDNFLFLCSISFFIHKTEIREFEWRKFLAPFSKELWIAVMTMMFSMSLCLTAIHSVGHRTETRHQFGFFKSLFHVHASFCQQGMT
jgi:uncharacterized membrane protein YfbV (UPF0208 family)